MKKSQLVMIWLLPIIVIAGLFYPFLGYIVVAMMAFLLVLSFFQGRYWCRNLCPRGAFLDIVLSKVSRNKPFSRLLVQQWFRLTVLVLFMGFLTFRLIKSGGSLVLIGAVFVGMCLISTIIAIAMGMFTRHRAWCAICPMGFLQEKVGRLRKK
ncbi:MAG: 4Fe-4S binding protein [Candidatus Omnitrophica bacterium]|nr:4Fe-4S binding protein [Candidatus Omnitrophota bacterium]